MKSQEKRKILAILGPTAVGKTTLAIKLAKEFKGELVNIDSRQVYQGMDIGTGKDLPETSKFNPQNAKLKIKKKKYRVGYYLVDKVPLWLLDIVKPSYRFSAADYVNCALPVIADIWARGKLPILVGGTGFYLKSLIYGIGTAGIKPDWRLRQQLENLSLSSLQDLLKELDEKRFNKMNYSDKNNPRRLIRAIEVTKKDKNKNGNLKVSLKLRKGLGLKEENVLLLGLRAPFKELYSRIDRRVKKRLKQGLLSEIEKLLAKGYDFKNSALGTTLAYREWAPYWQMKKRGSLLSEEQAKIKKEIIEKWCYDEHRYARRQMTWFRAQKNIHWFDIGSGLFPAVADLVRKWYDKR